jgi:hypothetical protein
VDSSQHLVKVVRVWDRSRYWVLSFVAVAFVIDASRLCSTSFECSVIESHPFSCCSLAIARTSSKLWIDPNFLSSINSEPVGYHY